MSKCPACGKEYRTGSTVTLLDANANAGGRGARVCKPCARGAMVIVAPKIAPKAAPKVNRDEKWIADVIRQLGLYAKAARGHCPSGPDAADYRLGRAEGLEMAIHILKTKSQ